MVPKLKRGDIVEYHNTGSCARLNGAVGVVKQPNINKWGIPCATVVWIVGDPMLQDGEGWYGHGVLRKVADGEV